MEKDVMNHVRIKERNNGERQKVLIIFNKLPRGILKNNESQMDRYHISMSVSFSAEFEKYEKKIKKLEKIV